MASYWYDRAYNALDVCLDLLPADATKRQIRAMAREAYPWGKRSGWMYSQFLRARGFILWQKYPKLFPCPGWATAIRRRKSAADVRGQMALFNPGA